MAKTYYEIVMEGEYRFVYGMLEGFKLALREPFEYYLSRHVNVKALTLMEALKGWLTFKTKLHHVIMEEGAWRHFEEAIKRQPAEATINYGYIKSVRLIVGASFEFNFECYAPKYGEKIKQLLASLPAGVRLMDYHPKEEIWEDAKGIELYAPTHDYIFEGRGKLVGDLETIMSLNRCFGEHPLIEVSPITLELQ